MSPALPRVPPAPSGRGVSFLAGVVAVATAVAVLGVSGASQDSATDDEPAHIVSGYLKLRHGALDFYPGQPP